MAGQEGIICIGAVDGCMVNSSPMEQVSAAATPIIGNRPHYKFLVDKKPTTTMLDLGCNAIVLSQEYCKQNNIKTLKTFHAPPRDIANRPIREFLVISEPIELEYNGHFTRETAVVIPSSKELLIPPHYLQHHKGNYNSETMGLEFKCSNLEHLRIEVSSITINIEWDESILDDPEAIQIGSLSTFSNTNLREVLPPAYHKYLLLFDPTEAEKLPTRTIFEHEIKLTVDPKKGRIYKLSAKELEGLKQYIQKMLAKGKIRLSSSSCSSPILFVPKKNGSLRLCVDYRDLNKITIKDATVTPLMDELMERVRGMTYFSKFDLKNGFNLIRIKEGDE
jgi:hypothetical protein